MRNPQSNYNTGYIPRQHIVSCCGANVLKVSGENIDKKWLERKLRMYDVMPKGGIGAFRKIVAGKQLWNYDNLEPTEKKLVL